MNPRCLVLFEESCTSVATKRTYRKEMDNFLKWASKDYESVLLLPDDQLHMLLEDYMLYMKRRFKKTAIQLKLAAVNKFFFVNDSIINTKKLKMFMPEATKKGGDRPITTDEIKKLLENTSLKRTKALIHVFAATGARPEALADLRIRNVSDEPNGCKSLLLYEDSLHEYYTFLHPEAVKALDEYWDERRDKGELLKPESFVFRKNWFIVNEKKPIGLSIQNIETIIKETMENAKIDRNKSGNRYDLAVCYGFRKRFNTIVKSSTEISFVTGEVLMDHTVKLESNYFKPTKDHLFEAYQKVIPELVISKEEKQRMEIQKQKEELSELKKLKQEIENLKEEKEQQRIKKKKEVDILQGGFGTKEKLLDYLKEELKKEFSKN